jgi:hypothetical protein
MPEIPKNSSAEVSLPFVKVRHGDVESLWQDNERISKAALARFHLPPIGSDQGTSQFLTRI